MHAASRPQLRSASRISSDTRPCAGSVTMFAIGSTVPSHDACHSGIAASGNDGPWCPAASPGITWSIAHWSRPVNAPVATRIASTAKTPLNASVALRGDANTECTGDGFERGRRRPDLLAVELDREALG